MLHRSSFARLLVAAAAISGILLSGNVGLIASAQTEPAGLSAGTGTGAPQDATQSAAQEEPYYSDEATREDPAQKVKESKAVSHYRLGSDYLGKWKLDLAQVEYEVAIMYWPDLRIAHRDLCLVSLLTGNPLRALAEFMMVVGLGEPVPLTDQERVQLNRQALKLHYRRGIAEALDFRWKDAIDEFEWALSYDPNDPRLHRSIAFAYANLDRFDEAEKQYSLSFAIDPSDALGHADFAGLLSERGQDEKAMSEMSEAIKLAPDAAAFHVDLGWMAESKGDLDAASSEFRKAVELSPRHAELWAHLGKILERQGKQEEAMDAYAQALRIDPQHDLARERQASLQAHAQS